MSKQPSLPLLFSGSIRLANLSSSSSIGFPSVSSLSWVMVCGSLALNTKFRGEYLSHPITMPSFGNA